MAHEELKKQYEEDCKKYKRPWELWEYKPGFGDHTWGNIFKPPGWNPDYEYRRKEPPFQPEYFSGLNWRDAGKLVGKVVEFSDDGENWCRDTLIEVAEEAKACRFISKLGGLYIYIRTTPATHAHPTITICGVELPRPETSSLVIGQEYFYFDPGNTSMLTRSVWSDGFIDNLRLNNKCVHLTKYRARAWASWWQNTVIKAVQK